MSVKTAKFEGNEGRMKSGGEKKGVTQRNVDGRKSGRKRRNKCKRDTYTH